MQFLKLRTHLMPEFHLEEKYLRLLELWAHPLLDRYMEIQSQLHQHRHLPKLELLCGIPALRESRQEYMQLTQRGFQHGI